MNKSELIDTIAQSADLSKASAARALEATLAAVENTLRQGGVVALPGFGSFYLGKRAARRGRNPRTGEIIAIDARRVVIFHASHKLKEQIQQAS